MSEKVHTYGIGFAMVDAKVIAQKNTITKLPREPHALVSFLDSQPEIILKAGGSTTNTMAAYTEMATDSPVRLFAAVGVDKRGDFLQRTTHPNLGRLQPVESKPTGTITYLLNTDGSYLDDLSFYGAATEVVIPKDILRDKKRSLFIANCFALSDPKVAQEVHKAAEVIVKNKGIFALNLSGATSAETSRMALRSSIDTLPRTPDIAVGNESEALQLTGADNITEALASLFPKSRLVVITRDKNGSILRFENNVIKIPVFPCTTVIDPTGAGDCYMGVILACLFEKPYNNWTLNDVRISATTASYAAARIVERMDSRLPSHQYKDIRLVYENLKKLRNQPDFTN